MQSFLNQADSTVERQRAKERIMDDNQQQQRAWSNVRGRQGGLNALDANLDLVPFDSVSNPNQSVRMDNPTDRVGTVTKKILNAGSRRPDMDSFYKDREEIRQKAIGGGPNR